MSEPIFEQCVDERGNISVRVSRDVQVLTREEANRIEAEYKRMQAENAKLRELAGELWFYAEQELVCDDNCPYGAACDWMEPTVVCVFKRRMRELGVEVD